MNLYLIGLILIALIGIEFCFKKGNKEYLSKENTACIKGLFILIVFYSHLCTYIPLQQSKDFLMYGVRNFLGQLMVTMFLFYSGYGIYESIKKKQENYVNTIPIKRIGITLFNFDIAVLTFAIANELIGNGKTISQILLALTGWGGIGNSNWYIFAILFLYLSTYISFKVFDNSPKKAIATNWILTILIMLIISIYRGPGYEYCYNTLICYPFGLTYSLYKEYINKIIFNNNKYIILLLTVLCSFLLFKKAENTNTIYYSLSSILFVSCILLFSVKINLKSPILKWCGENLFWLYILQRLPMLVLSKIGYANHAYRFALISFVATIILTYIYSKVFGKIDYSISKKWLQEEKK